MTASAPITTFMASLLKGVRPGWSTSCATGRLPPRNDQVTEDSGFAVQRAGDGIGVQTMVVPVPAVVRVRPRPPLRSSAPGPPKIESFPPPPTPVSLPLPSFRTLFSSLPLITSLNFEPTTSRTGEEEVGPVTVGLPALEVDVHRPGSALVVNPFVAAGPPPLTTSFPDPGQNESTDGQP